MEARWTLADNLPLHFRAGPDLPPGAGPPSFPRMPWVAGTFSRLLWHSVAACPFRSPFLGLKPISFILFYTWVKQDTKQFISCYKSCLQTPIQLPRSPNLPPARRQYSIERRCLFYIDLFISLKTKFCNAICRWHITEVENKLMFHLELSL